MRFIDRSPGAFVALAAAVVYSVIVAEAAMIRLASPVLMWAILAAAIVVAALIGRWLHGLLDDDG